MRISDWSSDVCSSDLFGAFLTTTIAFFIVEIGDKTQVATIALGAQFQNVLLVTVGTTFVMMLAIVPAVYFGSRLIELVPLNTVRLVAALLFLAICIWVVVSTLSALRQHRYGWLWASLLSM